MEVNISLSKVMGWIGLGIMLAIAIYLILLIIGVFHSLDVELLLLGVVMGQIFYNGYTYRAIQEMDKKIGYINRKLEK
jgi:c-di-AMP phosphodiesterase-like protein